MSKVLSKWGPLIFVASVIVSPILVFIYRIGGNHPCGPTYHALETVIQTFHLDEFQSIWDSFGPILQACLVGGGMSVQMPKNRMSYVHASMAMISDTQGNELQSFEREVEDFLGVKKAYFVSSGTAALVVAIQALGIGLGDEVVVPTYTWIATASSVTVNGAIPILADIDETLGINPRTVDAYITPRTKAIIAVHMQGVPCNITALRDVAKRRGLYLIEDNAQSFGSNVNGKMVGTFGIVGITSTNPSKTFQTGGQGGLVWTTDEKIAERLHWAIDNTVPTQGEFKNLPFAGHDMRNTNEWHAAYGRYELRQLLPVTKKMTDLKLAFRKTLKPEYQKLLQWQEDPTGDRSYSIWFVLKDKTQHERLKAYLADKVFGFGFNFDWWGIHYLPHNLPIIEKVSFHKSGFPWLSKEDQKPNKLQEYNVSNKIMRRTLRMILGYSHTIPMVVWLAKTLNTALDQVNSY